MSITLQEVSSENQLEEFVEFPFRLYRRHPHWIPPIKAMEKALLRPASNPAFRHSEAVLFLATQDGRTVGRIAGLINRLECEKLGEIHARFGWLDFEDDPRISAALFDAVEAWARARGAAVLKGPYGFTNLDKAGLLVEGFDSLGTIATLFNPPYYPQHLEKLGFEKEVDWVEVYIHSITHIPERIQRFVRVMSERFGLRVWRVRTRAELKARGRELFHLLQETYRNIHGFVPLTDEQVDLYMKQYLPFIRKDFIKIVLNERDEMVGFGLTMPSLSKAMKRAGGRLFPFGLLHLLWARTFNDSLDLVLIGVREEWRNKGVHALIFHEILEKVLSGGFRHIYVNPMLEHNSQVLSLWKDYQSEVYKRRRAYQKRLA